MKVIRSLLLSGFILSFLSTVQAAEIKMGFVDFKRAFDNYYKRKQAEDEFMERKKGFQKERQAYVDDYKKSVDEFNRLREEANNSALTPAKREEKSKAAEEKGKEAQRNGEALTEFENSRGRSLSDQRSKMMNNLISEVSKEVERIGKQKGFTCILNSTAVDAAGAPTMPYSDSTLDITEDVIKALNANQPAAGAGAKPAK